MSVTGKAAGKAAGKAPLFEVRELDRESTSACAIFCRGG